MSKENIEQYLGDGVYAEIDQGRIKLTAGTLNVIFLEPCVAAELVDYINLNFPTTAYYSIDGHEQEAAD